MAWVGRSTACARCCVGLVLGLGCGDSPSGTDSEASTGESTDSSGTQSGTETGTESGTSGGPDLGTSCQAHADCENEPDHAWACVDGKCAACYGDMGGDEEGIDHDWCPQDELCEDWHCLATTEIPPCEPGPALTFQKLGTGSMNAAPLFADVDGDSIPDLIWNQAVDQVWIRFGPDLSSPIHPFDGMRLTAATDVTGDDVLDLIGVSQLGHAVVYEGDGAGGFVFLYEPAYESDAVVGDVDGDGLDDVMLTDSVALAQGDGTFTIESFGWSFATEFEYPTQALAGAWGANDALVVSIGVYQGWSDVVLLPDPFDDASAITFPEPHIGLDARAWAVDLDLDGDDELILRPKTKPGLQMSFDALPNGVERRAVWQGFVPTGRGDVDGDGVLDLVAGGATSVMAFYRSPAADDLGCIATYARTAVGTAGAVDLDGDGRATVVFADAGYVYRGDVP